MKGRVTHVALLMTVLVNWRRTLFVKNPVAETAGRLKLNICFQCHSSRKLVG